MCTSWFRSAEIILLRYGPVLSLICDKPHRYERKILSRILKTEAGTTPGLGKSIRQSLTDVVFKGFLEELDYW